MATAATKVDLANTIVAWAYSGGNRKDIEANLRKLHKFLVLDKNWKAPDFDALVGAQDFRRDDAKRYSAALQKELTLDKLEEVAGWIETLSTTRSADQQQQTFVSNGTPLIAPQGRGEVDDVQIPPPPIVPSSAIVQEVSSAGAAAPILTTKNAPVINKARTLAASNLPPLDPTVFVDKVLCNIDNLAAHSARKCAEEGLAILNEAKQAAQVSAESARDEYVDMFRKLSIQRRKACAVRMVADDLSDIL